MPCGTRTIPKPWGQLKMKFQSIFLAVLVVGCSQKSINLQNLHACEGTVIQDTDYSFTLYSETIDNCGALNIIALEKLDYRDKNGKPFFRTIDTLSVRIAPGQILTTTYCNNGQELHIVLGEDPTADDFGTILKSWTANETRTQIIESTPRNLDCLNQEILE